MTRFALAAFAAAILAPAACAHFVYVVPQKDGKSVRVVFSDDLEPDEGVDIVKVAGLRLAARAGGKESALDLKKGDASLSASLPGGTGSVSGTLVYGVSTRGDSPALLVYHPRAVIGAPGKPSGEKAALEAVPSVAGGKVRFRLLAKGEPVADAEGSAILPGGKKEKLKTGKDGWTKEFAAAGRYGVWLRHEEKKAGEHGGRKYAAVKHYATLVFDLAEEAPRYAPMPEKVSSLGVCVAGDWIYVYGGHTGKMHSYDETTASGRFHRIKRAGGKWEELHSGPRVQGLALAAHGEAVIRVGGMQPRNKAGDPHDNHSLKGVQKFDPAARKWIDLPDMPSGRSSHDAAVIGGKLYVVGGWEMRGQGQPPRWHDTMLCLDLSARDARWQEVRQPFKRRALGAAAVGGKLYVVGGLGTEKSSGVVDVYDAGSGKWAKAPDLPGSGRHGFSPAACVAGGRLYVSTSDGALSRLKADGSGWEEAGKAGRRMVHRIAPGGAGRLVLLGGGVKEVEEAVLPR